MRLRAFLMLLFSCVVWGGLSHGLGRDSTTILHAMEGLPVAQSILVTRVRDGQVILEKDPDQLLSPASVTKVMTAATALARLTPVHTFKTPLYYTGIRQNHQITGDLIIVGQGDPLIVSEKLWQLASDIRNMGIREFAGDLVIDSSLFDEEIRDESRKDSVQWSINAYDAPIAAFSVNFNTMSLMVAPNLKPGKPAFVAMDPYPLRGVLVEGRVQTGRAKSAKIIDVKRVSSGGTEKLLASGSIPLNASPVKIYRSVGDPVRVSGESVKAFFQAAGVIVRGQVKAGLKPAQASLLTELESYDVRRMVSGLNTYSNNFIADMMVKRLGVSFPAEGSPETPGQGTYANGLKVMTSFLRKDVGIKTDFVLKNGSGLDTENRLSARQVVSLLLYMERRMDLFPDFLASLPATGWEGTLKKRLLTGDSGDPLKGLIRAKTGTLSEPVTVASLAGYFRHPNHGLMAFCVIENGHPGGRQPTLGEIRDRQDGFMKRLLDLP